MEGFTQLARLDNLLAEIGWAKASIMADHGDHTFRLQDPLPVVCLVRANHNRLSPSLANRETLPSIEKDDL